MMGYQTRALPGSGTWMMESGIRNRITEWYLFVEKKDPSEILHVSKRSESWENGKNCRETEDGGAGRKNHGYLWECSAAACLYVCT